MDKTDRLRDYGLAFLLYEHGLGVCGYELIRELFIFIKLILNSYLPLYPKVVNESVTKTFNFKERLVNVKLKDIDAWTTEHLSKNWVTERTKTLKQMS